MYICVYVYMCVYIYIYAQNHSKISNANTNNTYPASPSQRQGRGLKVASEQRPGVQASGSGRPIQRQKGI